MLNWLSARTRLSAGLVAILGCLLLAAMTIGLIPDRSMFARKNRAELCETLAINFSVLANRNDLMGIRQSLEAILDRHPEILSAGVRDRFGRMMVEVKEHNQNWPKDANLPTSDTHVQVPVFRGSVKYANVEFRFTPLEASGLLGWIQHPWTLLMAFVNSAGFVLFSLYLGMMLRQLDPSHAVPGHVRRALNNLAEGLMVLDVKGRMVLVNSAFESIVGFPETKLLGKRPKLFQWMTEGHQPMTDFPWHVASSTGQPVLNTFIRLKTADERMIVFNVNCAPISTNGSESSFGVMVSLEDITQIDEAKVQIQKSRDEADAANRAKSDFLANMSHEIRTPMNAILGFTELLRRGMVDDKRETDEYLSTIHTSGSHLLDLINDILDLSKIESGKMEMELIPCSPFKIIDDVVNILSVRAKDKGLTLIVDASSRLPNEITTDPVRVRQIITNLVGNAIKFTEHGEIRVKGLLNSNGMLEFRIRDTGVGMTPEQLDRIFTPFAQADSSVTRRFGGTGLGLSISRRISRALGGELSVESEAGQGSTFIAQIDVGPIDPQSLITWAQHRATGIAQVTTKKSVRRFHGERILAVDDGEANLRLIRLILEKANLVVDMARNGQQAIEKAQTQDYSLVFMDIQMPILDGYSATRKLRDSGYAVPIVALTAHALRGEEEKCLSAGCTAYLAKPIDLDQLIETVARFIPASECLPDVSAPRLETRTATTTDGPRTNQVVSTSGPRIEFRNTTLGRTAVQWVAPRQPLPRKRIRSNLPLESTEVREIVCDFQVELQGRLTAMAQCLKAQNWSDLAHQAHWLKGAGGTVGFGEFVQPSSELEQAANVTHDMDQACKLVKQIIALSEMIELPDVPQLPQTR